jgi:hypothetical protein
MEGRSNQWLEIVLSLESEINDGSALDSQSNRVAAPDFLQRIIPE